MKLLSLYLLLALPTMAGEDPLAAALRAIRMSPADLTFKKDLVESEFVPPLARQCLQQPLALPAFAETTRQDLAIISNLTGLANFTNPKVRMASAPRPAFDLAAIAASTASRLPRPDPALWQAFALSIFSAKADRAAFAPALFPREEALELQDDEPTATLLAAARQLDQAQLHADFAVLCRAIDEALPSLLATTTNEFRDTLHTPHGDIILGGAGPNTYSFTNSPPLLLIDFGGDDHYEFACTNPPGGVSIILDLAGNDAYSSRGIGGPGAGIFGIGILVDCAGNDTYTGQHITQGAGVFGCGLLADFAGQDKFNADTFAQGAGQFGTGILWQRGGDTTYRAAEKAQAYAGTLGTGLLLDVAGNDRYFAGGKYPCRWLDGHHFSLAQGMAIGSRPFAGGGLAVLADLAGNDAYEADVYGQGASYWYSIGLLLDVTGNDSYKAYQYAQGAGIHLSSGLLWDGAGDDVYDCHAICQGGAHDYAVGIQLDDDGNDRYTADSTAQAGAINNSFALLLDRAGNDSYTGTDTNRSQATGSDGGRREYGSIAVLLDLGGADKYSQGWTNNSLWTKPWHGAGLDTVWSGPGWRYSELPVEERQSASKLAHSKADVHHPIERLVRRATRDWETEAEKKDTEAAEAELAKRAAEALSYLLTRLDSPSVLLRAKAEQLVDQLGTNAVPLLLRGIETAGNDEIARVCCYFLARFESSTNAVPVLLPLLERDATRVTALYTLGHLRAQEAFGSAASALASDRELVRLRGVQALARIGHPHAITKLVSMLDDEFFAVRYAAEDALVKFGWRSLEPLRQAMREASPRARPHIRATLDRLKRK